MDTRAARSLIRAGSAEVTPVPSSTRGRSGSREGQVVGGTWQYRARRTAVRPDSTKVEQQGLYFIYYDELIIASVM